MMMGGRRGERILITHGCDAAVYGGVGFVGDGFPPCACASVAVVAASAMQPSGGPACGQV